MPPKRKEPTVREPPAAKPAKKAKAPKKEKAEGEPAPVAPAAAPKSPAKGKKTPAKATEDEGGAGLPVIRVEASKECQCFKKRTEVLQGLLKGKATFVVNETKPGKGNFVITVPSGTKVIELLGLPRPFKQLKDLDFEDVAKDVLAAL